MMKPYAIYSLYIFMRRIVIVFISFSELLFIIKLFHILLATCPRQRVHIEVGMPIFNVFATWLKCSATIKAFIDTTREIMQFGL